VAIRIVQTNGARASIGHEKAGACKEYFQNAPVCSVDEVMRSLSSMLSSESEATVATRASLLERLKDWEDQASWQQFFDTYWKLIYDVARRSGLPEADARDIVQETLLTAARQLPGFKYDRAVGRFKNWLLTVTRSRIIDHHRRKQRHARNRVEPPGETASTPLLERIPSPAADELDRMWDEEWESNLATVALDAVKRRVKPGMFQLFDWHVIRGRPVSEVSRRLQVTATQVYFAKYRVSALLRKEVRRLKQEWG
jgi:RNA polymerase sigma factor (sigma-70 family)